MKSRPILFSAPMVRAILRDVDPKTQTRRVCKNKVYGNGFKFDGQDFLCHDDYLPPSALLMDYRTGGYDCTTSDFEGWGDACPHGMPGDHLWVRENGWERPERTPKMMRDGADTWEPYYFDADGINNTEREEFKEQGFKRRPSIHMPRWASRITLEIISVRVERLQDISESDALAEGIESITGDKTIYHWDFPKPYPDHAVSGYQSARSAYQELWCEISGRDSYDANPWVWVIEFRRVEQ